MRVLRFCRLAVWPVFVFALLLFWVWLVAVIGLDLG